MRIYMKEFKAEIASLRREWTSTFTGANFRYDKITRFEHDTKLMCLTV